MNVITPQSIPLLFYREYQKEIIFHEPPHEISELLHYENTESVEVKIPIVFTNYYTGDNTGSGSITSSGLTTDDFKVNSKGWYTYKGYVVLAAATQLCLDVKSGACGKYSKLPSGFTAYELKDIIVFEIENRRYEGIILDSCGACMVRDAKYPEHQKFDIFISNSEYSFGKITGELIMEE